MSDRPTISAKTKVQVLERQAICFYCKKPLVPHEDGVEYDHVKARALGGSDDASNLVAAHASCHRAKTDIDLAKIASENRRIKKRARATEKRALAQYARRMDLQKLIIRGSDLLPDGDSDDYGRALDGLGSSEQRSYNDRDSSRTQKARPKNRWGKRPFGKGRKFSVRPKDRQEDHGGDENDNAPDQD